MNTPGQGVSSAWNERMRMIRLRRKKERPRFNFCSSCKCNLHPSCPNCKQEIAETDKFCPNCAQELKPAELQEALTKPISQG